MTHRLLSSHSRHALRTLAAASLFTLVSASQAAVLPLAGPSTVPAPPTEPFGNASVHLRDGSRTLVPEPDSHALLLAGLGVVGSLARRCAGVERS